MVARLKDLWNRRRWTVIGGTAMVAGAGWGGVWLARTAPKVPTAEVRRGEFVDYVQVRGEVKALHSIILIAPFNAGDIQIVRLTRNGDRVHKGDVVVQFDTTTLQQTLDQKGSELKTAEADIEGARAQARLQQEQDLTELMKARYDVERAKLDASKQEILSRIEGEKTKLNLADAEQKLREIEERLKSHQMAAAADIESKKQKRDKALFEMRQAERNLVAMTLRAPVDGMVTLLPNWRAGGFFSGSAPEFKEGDRTWPGAAIAELPDLSALRIAVRADETDRGRLKPGQSVAVRVDAVPDKEFSGSIAEIGALAKPDFSGWPPAKNFDVAIQLEQADPRMRPGMSATSRVAVGRAPDSILIPAEAAFQKAGRTVAYVLRGSKFEERVVEVARRGNGEVALARGLQPGERVALRDPTLLESSERR